MKEASTTMNITVDVSITSDSVTSFTAGKFVGMGPSFASESLLCAVIGQRCRLVHYLAFPYDRGTLASGDL